MSTGEKTALVTGACGFSAPWVIRFLLKQGWKVKATDLAKTSKEHLKEFKNKIEFVPADLTKPKSLKPLFSNIDLIFHTAAMFSYSAPLNVLRKVNVDGTKHLLDYCLKTDVKKMVMWSSVAMYGEANPRFYKMPITEDQKLNPKTGGRYDTSKREQEVEARKYWEENKFPITFLRPAPIYGPGSYYGIYTLFKYIKYEMLPTAPRNLHKASVPLAHALDVAKAALHVMDYKKFNGEAYNVVDDNNLDMIDTFKYVATLTDSKFKVMMPIYPLKILLPFLKLLGRWSSFEAQHLRKKINGKPPIPKLETDTILYMFGNFWFSSQKLKNTGFRFTYSDRRLGLLETITWYEENGWEKSTLTKEAS